MASDEHLTFTSSLNENLPFDLNELPNLEGDECDEFEEAQEVDQNNTDIPILQAGQEVEGAVPFILDLNVHPDFEHQDSADDELNEVEHHGQRRNTILSNEEKQLIYHALLEKSMNNKLKRNTTKEVASQFSVPLHAVQRIWRRARETPHGTVVSFASRRPRNSGRKRVEIDLNRIKGIPLNRRTPIRSMSKALNLNKDTLFRRFKEGLIRRHSNAIKPYLTAEHKVARLKWCLSMLDASSLPYEPRFVDMYDVVHIDEKWFYMTKRSTSYYMLTDEEEPLRSCKSKNFIGKVMFIAAVARPRFDNDGNETFSGEIGVFPLVTVQPAQRRSRNREAGTLETKPITFVKKETIRTFLLEKIIPAIQAKWPWEDSGRTIFIQQDNARTHIRPDDEEFRIVASQNGFDIRLRCQPANSPDLNVLDLGFFNAIQSLQDKECAKTVDDLILPIENAFAEYPTTKINHVFLALQGCLKEIMAVGGSIGYKLPHMYKVGLERRGQLPQQITCDYDLVQNAINIVENNRG